MRRSRPGVESSLTAYLAGPEVFLPEALDIGRRKKEICRNYGFGAIFPLDRLPDEGISDPLQVAREIFEICLGMLDESDLVIANMTPFRGVSLDVGTAVELGYMYALGKPAFGYSNLADDYRQRVEMAGVAGAGQLVEDFGLSDNVMCEGTIRWPKIPDGKHLPFVIPVVRRHVPGHQLWTSLDGFEDTVRQARDLVDQARDILLPVRATTKA